MDTGVLVAITGGGFTFAGVLYAEYIRRSSIVSVSKLDDRQTFTDTIIKELTACKNCLDSSEKIRSKLDRDIARRDNVIEIIEFEIEGIRPFHDEFITAVEETDFNGQLAARYNRMVTRISTLLEHLKESQPLIGSSEKDDYKG